VTKDDLKELLASDGTLSGIESEDDQVGQAIEQPFDPDKIDVTTRTMTVDLLLSRIKSGAIDLAPDFQRRAGIWNEERQSRLIESLLLRIPLPTLYAAEDEVETWAIVDGIQRLTTIARFMEPDAIRQTRLSLSGLEYLSNEFDGAVLKDLPVRLQRRLRETELVVHVIRHGTPEEVKFNIFARINTGGLPLSSQELRHALIPGNARTILKQWASTSEFLHATDKSIKDDRMADRELILRYIAFRLYSFETYNSKDYDEFLRRAMRALNQLEDAQVRALRQEFLDVMITAKEIFGKHAFRKIYSVPGSRYPINRALFDSVSIGLANVGVEDRKRLILNKKEIVEAFIKMMRDQAFDSAISQSTGNPAKVKLRFRMVADLLLRLTI
jgi:hypothetical protein